MKTKFLAFLTMSLLSATMAHAQPDTKLPSDAMKAFHITGQVASITNMCPPYAMCIIDGQNVNLTFTLPGCVDQLGDVDHFVSFDEDRSVANIYVAAIAVTRRSSMLVRCFAPNIKRHSISLPSFFGDVNVHFLSK